METDIKIEETIIAPKNGYAMLKEFTSFNADFNSFTKQLNPITNRVQYIMHQLDANNIEYTVDKYQPIVGVPDAEEGKFAEVNIVVEIEGDNRNLTTAFSAHHDVANMNSDNVQDNSASVCNLLDLCIRLSKNKPTNNVVICFNDSEEKLQSATCGIQRFYQNIRKGIYGQVKYCVTLELTAQGQNYWMSYNQNTNILANHIREIQPNVHRVRTPYNDSIILEWLGIPSVCIGSLNDNNLNQVKTRGFCHAWGLCHSLTDTFEHSAVEVDMNLFINFLETLI